MIKVSINAAKIPKDKVKQGQNGARYLDMVLFENKGGKDQYGNDGFVTVDTTKEEREAGTRGPIIGNWKHIGQKPAQPTPAQKPKVEPMPGQPPFDEDDGQEIPF